MTTSKDRLRRAARNVRRRVNQPKLLEALAQTGRECGPCSACCNAKAVPPLRKPAGTPCEHVSPDGGCAIHGSDERPRECGIYYCAWRVTDRLRDEHRPDVSGLVIDPPKQALRPFVAWEVWPGAADQPPGQGAINALCSQGFSVAVATHDGQRRLFGRPDLLHAILRSAEAATAEGGEP